jgi:hypothetical protein
MRPGYLIAANVLDVERKTLTQKEYQLPDSECFGG